MKRLIAGTLVAFVLSLAGLAQAQTEQMHKCPGTTEDELGVLIATLEKSGQPCLRSAAEQIANTRAGEGTWERTDYGSKNDGWTYLVRDLDNGERRIAVDCNGIVYDVLAPDRGARFSGKWDAFDPMGAGRDGGKGVLQVVPGESKTKPFARPQLTLYVSTDLPGDLSLTHERFEMTRTGAEDGADRWYARKPLFDGSYVSFRVHTSRETGEIEDVYLVSDQSSGRYTFRQSAR